MTPLTNTESATIRFASYLEPLRAFLHAHDVPCGEPGNIALLAAQLAAPGPFYEEASTMLRNMVARDDGSITRAELLEILCVAAGGPSYNEATLSIEADVGQLLLFVNVVLLSIRKRAAEATAERGGDRSDAVAPQIVPTTNSLPLSTGGAPALDSVINEAIFSASDRSGEALSPPAQATSEGEVSVETSKVRASDSLYSATHGDDFSVSAHEPQLEQQRASVVNLSGQPVRRPLLSKPARIVAVAVLFLLATVMALSRRPGKQGSKPAVASALTSLGAPQSGGVKAQGQQGSSSASGSAAGQDASVKRLANDPEMTTGKDNFPPFPSASAAPSADAAVDSSPLGSVHANPGSSDSDAFAGGRDEAANRSSAATDTPPSRNPTATEVRSPGPPEERAARMHDAFTAQHSSKKGLFSVSSGGDGNESPQRARTGVPAAGQTRPRRRPGHPAGGHLAPRHCRRDARAAGTPPAAQRGGGLRTQVAVSTVRGEWQADRCGDHRLRQLSDAPLSDGSAGFHPMRAVLQP